MIITAVVGMIFGLIDVPDKVVDSVPSIEPTFGAVFSSFGDSSFYSTTMVGIILTFLFVDFFDNAGTLVAVANQAGLSANLLPMAALGPCWDATVDAAFYSFGRRVGSRGYDLCGDSSFTVHAFTHRRKVEYLRRKRRARILRRRPERTERIADLGQRPGHRPERQPADR